MKINDKFKPMTNEQIISRIKKITGLKHINQMKKNYKTYQVYDLEYINERMKKMYQTNKPMKLYKIPMHISSLRYTLFNSRKQICVECGLEPSFWLFQSVKGQDRPHLNLYGVDKHGNIVLFTKDHIKPTSKGGANDMRNLQIMCQKCNSKKGDE